jgi:hypothetical protein
MPDGDRIVDRGRRRGQMTERELRPGARQNVRDPSGLDEISGRANMEASENTEPSQRRGGGPAPHRIDLNQVAGIPSSSGNADGFARLNLMVSTIFERLTSDDRQGLSER